MPKTDQREKPEQRDETVRFEVDAEDAAPFELNPTFMSLGLPRAAFRKDVGGDSEEG